MSRHVMYLMCLVLLLGSVSQAGLLHDPNLVAVWSFDEGSGNVATDSSFNGNDGTIEGTAVWGPGVSGAALSFDSVDNVVRSDQSLLNDVTDVTIACWLNVDRTVQPGFTMDLFGQNGVLMAGLAGMAGPRVDLRIVSPGAPENNVEVPFEINTWHHVAIVNQGMDMHVYFDGVLAHTGGGRTQGRDSANGFNIGGKTGFANSFYDGEMDDFALFDRALTADEVWTVMEGTAFIPEVATLPNPADGETNLPRNVVLNWAAGALADVHDVYFDTDAGALSLVGAGQDATMYDPGLLAWDQTYYWRIDEVQADGFARTGDIWSFSTEPIGIPVALANITATASSANGAAEGPETTLNASDLDADAMHSAECTAMWLSSYSDPNPAWIQYEFGRVYKLHQMSVWNQNTWSESIIGYGIKEATVEVSTDGFDWIPLASTLDDPNLGTHEFAQAPGADGYAANTIVDLGVPAQYVRITANSNWGADFLPQYGLSEVRFTYTPVLPIKPQPVSGTTDVDADVTLTWQAGREAVEHEVYLSTDQQAVIDGTAPVVSLTENSFSPAIDLGHTYYWKVIEVNTAETPVAWAGDVWKFTTPDFLIVDDFESYNNDSENYNRIFQVWVDGAGYTTPAPGDPGNGSGALVGASDAPWVEQTIVYDGMKSMPVFYNNANAVNSEATRTFSPAQDWTGNGIKALTLMFYGDAANTAQQMYVKINGVKVPYDGDADDLKKPLWQRWYIDLTSLSVSSVTELTIGFERMGATAGQGTMLFDAIRLDSRDAASIEPSYVNILTNGGFEDGVLEPWNLNNVTAEVVQDLTGATVPEAPIEGDSSLHITIAKTDEIGEGFWMYNTSQDGFVFEAGKKYTLSVFLKAKAGTEMRANLRPSQTAGNYPNFNEKFVNITDTWAEYSTTTDVFSVDTAPGGVIIQLGFASGEIWMDDVRFYEGDYVPSEPAGPSLGLVGHWKFDEDGGAIAFDETGNGLDGAINGAQVTEGRLGGALLFDEIDDHVSVPDFDYGTDYTVAFWLKSSGNEGTGWQYMFSHAGWNAPNSLNIYFGENNAGGYEGTIRTLLRDADDADAHTATLDINADLVDGNWHHYALTVASGIGTNVYIDGALMASEQSRGGDAFDPATDLFLGARSDLNSERLFGGALDDVRIYDRSLTEIEVAGLAGR